MKEQQQPVPDPLARSYCFGRFTLDLFRGSLCSGQDEVKLRPKSFELLRYLVENSGRLVAKEELIAAVWPDVAVTDDSLVLCIKEVRRALNDDAQAFIKTVPRRGYLFALEVTRGSTPSQPRAGDRVEPIRLAPPQPAKLSGSGRDTSEESLSSPVLVNPPARKRFPWQITAGACLLLAAAAGALVIVLRSHAAKNQVPYTQITDFTDSAVAPALSPDGRMLAFIRGDSAFVAADQIYVKLLPGGEAVRLTNDRRPKYSLAFSPDGSQIAYTAYGPSGWETDIVSPLGGEPHLLLTNAAGLTWLNERELLFSQQKAGQHMGIVTATESRAGFREVYFPKNERAMAHYSFASPDRKWALVVEMDKNAVWLPCRLIPLDGSSQGRTVGPKGECTSAGWSPDGAWMYFAVAVDGKSHIWRQRFPNRQPEQITSGPTEEQGVAVAPDGRSLITSIGAHESAIWIHETRGDRPLTSEGEVASRLGSVSFPSFAPDGKHLYYVLRREPAWSSPELWRMDVESAKSEAVLPGVSMLEYDVSPDGREVVYSTLPASGESQLWLASLDRSSPPKRIASSGEQSPHFGPNGQVLFRLTDGKFNYLARMNQDGSGRSKVVPYPISTIQSISPGRRWVIAITPFLDGSEGAASMAVPTGGGAPRRLCQRFCSAEWSPDGKFVYLGVQARSATSPGRTLAIPVGPGETLPELPTSGTEPLADAAAMPGARTVEYQGDAMVPGLDPSTFVYVKTTVHRNLFRIPLPR